MKSLFHVRIIVAVQAAGMTDIAIFLFGYRLLF